MNAQEAVGMVTTKAEVNVMNAQNTAQDVTTVATVLNASTDILGKIAMASVHTSARMKHAIKH